MLTTRVLLVAAAFLLVHYEETSAATTASSRADDELPVSRQRIDTDAVKDDHRHSRVSLHSKLPTSKAKREQILRNLLTARRRQVLTNRTSDSSSRISLNVQKSRFEPSKDSVDVLEMEETQHSIYVTLAADSESKLPVKVPEDEPVIVLEKTPSDALEKSHYNTSVLSLNVTLNNISNLIDAKNESTTMKAIPASGSPTTNLENSKNTTSVNSIQQKVSEQDTRNKNTVSMSESLYNHFRPVESNIPVEDMTQFLYFGQKIHPVQNTTNNNSVEVTSAATSNVPVSRRRHLTKKVSTVSAITGTTPTVSLEEILNEEMNIAVDHQTVEKNKISKMKNTFRTPGTGHFYKKPPVRPSDLTIISNVIPARELVRNNTESSTKGLADSRTSKYSANSSAHAVVRKQLSDREGTNKTANATAGNAVDTAYFANRQRDQVKTFVENVGDIRESSIPLEKARGIDVTTSAIVDLPKPLIWRSSSLRTKKKQRISSTTSSTIEDKSEDGKENAINATSFSKNVTKNSNKFLSSKKIDDMIMDQPIEETSSTLRIVITETTPNASSGSSSNGSEKIILKTPTDPRGSRTRTNKPTILLVRNEEEGRVHSPENVPDTTVPSTTMTTSSATPVAATAQHVYAYTITNVTRLLRNYTGPGLSREEQRPVVTASWNTGTSEIRSGPFLLPLLPTPHAGIETARTASELSADTTVEGAATRGSASVGERGRKVVAASQVQRTVTLAPRIGAPNASKVSNGTARQNVIIRWNHNSNRRRNLDSDSQANERRLLRKSASAVLNQRSGDEPQVLKRRRLAGRRLHKTTKTVENPTILGPVGSMGNQTEISVTDYSTNAVTSDATVVTEHSQKDGIKNEDKGSETEEEEGVTTESTFGSPDLEVSGSTTTRIQEVNATADPEPDDAITENMSAGYYEKVNGSLSDSETTGPSEIIDGLQKDSSEKRNQPQSVPVVDMKVSEEPETTVALILTTTTVPKETVQTTTIPPPVFPVTPKILTGADRNVNETATANLSHAVDDKPLSKDPELTQLDPSEIQKMYRSKTTVRQEVTSTATLMTVTSTTEKTIESENGKNTSVSERSPEVRGRNLSDDVKESDDILPIMHLYNTSNIFNESESTKSNSTESITVKLNVPITPRENLTPIAMTPRTTTKPTIAKTERYDESLDHIVKTNGKPMTGNRTRHRPTFKPNISLDFNESGYVPMELNRTFFEPGLVTVNPRDSVNISEVISKRHDGDTIASQETIAVVSYILATFAVLSVVLGFVLTLRRLILRNRKVLEESDTSSEISCRKDALNLENGDFKTSIEKAITKLPRIQHLCHEAEKPPPPPSQESRWEFPRDKLRLQTVLGEGNFGQVWKAEADDLKGHQGTTRLVAVKTVKEGAADREKEDLIRELEIMQRVGSHPNVVTLLGCCTEEAPHYLILEYVMYGKLLAYLRDHRTRQDFYNFSEDSAALTSRDLTVFGYCVARGMEYLASKKIIHRDLAARNVLVDHNKLCKIADFGMSRFANEDGEVIETRHGRNALPIRWMAPESLIYSLFTTKTDVWSFGILMWEIVTLGSTPYPDMTAREVMRNVQNGYRLERPSHCRSELFRVISRCWHADPDRRPEFQMLRRDLAQLLEDNMNGHYVDLESFASERTD